jgi:hypothetical protein
MKKYIAIGLALAAAILCAGCLAGKGNKRDGKPALEDVVVHWEVVENPERRKEYTDEEIQKIESAKGVVKKYWVSSHEDAYDLFSSTHKKMLDRIYGVKNSKQYRDASMSERVWRKQTYQSAKLDHYKGVDHIQVVVLSEWFQEGDRGVMTFNFYMVEEDGEWRIVDIIY